MATSRYGDHDFLDAWGTAWSADTPDGLLELYTPDARYRDEGSQMTWDGREGIARFFRFMLKFAPDTVVDFDSAFGEATGFASHWVWSGTAKGPLRIGDQLLDATGVAFSVPGVAYCTLGEDGLIASHEDYYDMRAVIEQISAAQVT